MSMPNIPDITPVIGIDIDDSINMLISSIAMQEIGLSHIINAEAEKIQYVLGTLETTNNLNEAKQYSIEDILKINKSVGKTLRDVLRNQMMLQMKFEDSIDLYYKSRSKCCGSSGIRINTDYGD